ncbi:hypothetical protein ACFUOZ_16720 [Paenarthrobacter sp. NPDC057355]|uniref:hypothetical protein n=1 Tax=Paenarthrobacter sp. NPDC057355 TaxID=3346105 RepID=UPI003645E73D
MSSGASAGRGSCAAERIGHNRLAHAAIRKTVESVTAHAFGVETGDVSARLDDDAGRLGVNVTVKLALPPLLLRRSSPETVFEQAQAARKEIVARGTAITGLTIGRVDIRLTGGKPRQPKERRVE